MLLKSHTITAVDNFRLFGQTYGRVLRTEVRKKEEEGFFIMQKVSVNKVNSSALSTSVRGATDSYAQSSY